MSAGAPVAVAVVSWNTRELLRVCLRSLEPDRERGLAEVWVVDNGSSDGSPELVEDEFAGVELIRAERNLGFGAAVNLVGERSDAAYIAPANADIELEPGALRRLLESARSSGAAIVAPRLITLDGSTQHSVHSFPTVTLSLLLFSGLPGLVPSLGDRLCIEGRWDPDRRRAVDWAHGAFLLVDRAAFDRAGRFDPEQWMYAEDLDIAWRVAATGGSTLYEPAARIHHAVSAATTQAFGDERQARYMRASYAWMVRRRGLAVAWAFAAVNVAGATVRWLLGAIAARLSGGRLGRARGRWRAYVPLHRQGLRRRSRLLGDG
jgi:N-acetylglucosaminyl-diphospho-decaprenol L-rhamnosyltransferase